MARDRSKNRQESQAVAARQGGQVSRQRSMPAFSPIGMMRRFAEEMDRMFEGFGLPSSDPWSTGKDLQSFSPEIEMFERDGKLVLRADLPGLSKDDVKVDVTEDAVMIEGERKYEHEDRSEGIYKSERSYGRFHREVALPEGVKSDTAAATYKDGVLELTFDMPQTSKNRRRIEIDTGQSGRNPNQTAA
jgi:HSP20 family protein